MNTKDELHHQIVCAFAATNPPQRGELVRGNSLEAAQIRNYLAPRTWQQLGSTELANYDNRADLSALPAFLSDEGFRYYLPALLDFIQRDFDRAGLLVDSVVSALGRSKPVAYSVDQREVVAAILLHLLDVHPNDELMRKELRRTLEVWQPEPGC
jgi:hypothetical protein